MKVFISGASGLLGSNCMQVFLSHGWEVMGTYLTYQVEGLQHFDTLHISSEQEKMVHEFGPDVIVHCGALTHVDYCQSHEEESYQKTVQSTINLVSLAQSLKAKFVFISTDYIFDGNHGPYLESDVPNPLSVYGNHKLMAEKYVISESHNPLILRITNVYGNELRNKNFVSRIIDQCIRRNEMNLELPKDQFATPTNALDIARAIYELLKDSKSGIYHMAGIEYMNRVDLALEIIKHFPDAQYKLEAKTTQELMQDAPRPLLGGLIRQKFSMEYPNFKWSTVSEFVNEYVNKNT